MKDKYIKQVKKELFLSRKAKKEIVRDLIEVFDSALEHGETEQEVIERLGTPREFADNASEQLGAYNTSLRKRRAVISSVIALIISIAAFAACAAARSGRAPDGAIGYADAMTNIRVEGIFGMDISQSLLAAGLISAAIAAVQAIRVTHQSRRKL